MSDEINDLLMKAAELAQAEGINFVAFTDDTTTVSIRDQPSFAVRMVYMAAMARGNADRFMLGLIRHAREHGPGESIFLRRELNAK